jgi:hypothetical protein
MRHPIKPIIDEGTFSGCAGSCFTIKRSLFGSENIQASSFMAATLIPPQISNKAASRPFSCFRYQMSVIMELEEP